MSQDDHNGTMNDTNEFLSRVLSEGAKALAAYAANGLLETHPEAAEGFEPDPFTQWRDWLAARVQELAAAVAAAEPNLFAEQVQWAKTALAARGIPPEHFRAGLESLRAVLDQELPEPLRPTAAQYLDHALESFGREPKDTRLQPETPDGRLCSKYLLALLEGDSPKANRLVIEAMDGGYDVPDVYLRILLPAQEEIGEMWLTNEITVAEEHFVSQATRRIMSQILPQATFRPPNGKTFLAAAVDGNQHDIGLQAVADFFEIDGWRAIYLGASVPIRDIVQAIEDFDVQLLGLSASQTIQLQTVGHTIKAVRQAAGERRIKILVGGRAFADGGDLPNQIGADGFAASPVDAVRIGNQLLPNNK